MRRIGPWRPSTGPTISRRGLRALLIARAPSLREAAVLALRSFRAIAANDRGRAGEAAEQLLPYYETVLHGLGAEDEGPA
jgi:hypothetical protein